MFRPVIQICILCLPAACSPIRTTIENDLQMTVSVEVVAKDGRVIAHGLIPAKSGLDLKEPITGVSEIRYSFLDKRCILQSNEFRSERHFGADAIHIKAC